jgi:hypothetical protein
MDIVETTQKSCDLTKEQAEHEVNSEVNNLRDLLYADDLRFSDFEDACENLGVETDNIDELMSRLCF